MQLSSTRYFTGKPCKYGHIAQRMMSTHACVKCLAERKKRSATRLKINVRCRNRFATDPEYRRKIAIRSKKYAQKLSYKKWKKAYGETYRSKNSLIIKAKRRQTYLRDPISAQRYWHERRARKLGAKGKYTRYDVIVLIKKQKNKCLCGASFNLVSRTLDHKIPLSRGGSNYPRNLQLLCQPCNDSKGARTMREWKPKKELLHAS